MPFAYDIEEYVTSDGDSPFGQWLLGLKDARAQAKIRAKLARVRQGNFGDWKKLKNADGICEMREHYSPGYRVFYTVAGQKIVLLLAGSTKKDQEKTIEQAKRYLADYKRRNTGNEQ